MLLNSKIINVFISLLLIFCLCACSEIGKESIDPDAKYYTLIDNINNHDSFVPSSKYYDIKTEMAKINDGYRFYITIDNPKIALYDVEALAIEDGVDYTNSMAANVGIFDEKEYSLIPNQKNPDKGFVSGLVFSGVTDKNEITLYIYVSFKNQDFSNTHTEYLKMDVKFETE